MEQNFSPFGGVPEGRGGIANIKISPLAVCPKGEVILEMKTSTIFARNSFCNYVNRGKI